MSLRIPRRLFATPSILGRETEKTTDSIYLDMGGPAEKLSFHVNPTRTLPNLGEGDSDRAHIFTSSAQSNKPENERPRATPNVKFFYDKASPLGGG